MNREMTREKIAALREVHRRKMNNASARAEMAASVGDMKEVSINSTESERHRETFVALNVAIDLFDRMDCYPEMTEAMHDAFFKAKDEYETLIKERISPRPSLPAFTWNAMREASAEGKQ